MDTIRAYYCVIQYVPDVGRAEAANTGVALLVPSRKWLGVRVSPTLDRVRHFFRPNQHEFRSVEIALQSLKNRLLLSPGEFATEEELAHFAAARADAMRLTAPRLVKIVEPQADLDRLYEKLVGEFAKAPSNASPLATLPKRVVETFGRLEAQRKLWRPGTIQIPAVHRPFEVSAAFKNGRVNYIRLESLARGQRLGSRMKSLGFNGRLIYQHPIGGHPSKLVVLSANPEADPHVEEQFASTLLDFNVEFVPHSQAEDFAATVEETAH